MFCCCVVTVICSITPPLIHSMAEYNRLAVGSPCDRVNQTYVERNCLHSLGTAGLSFVCDGDGGWEGYKSAYTACFISRSLRAGLAPSASNEPTTC
jgi:hypothetical protein